MNNNIENTAEPFGPVIYSYTRSQAVGDGLRAGVLVDDRAERLGGVVVVSVHKSPLGAEVAKLAQA